MTHVSDTMKRASLAMVWLVVAAGWSGAASLAPGVVITPDRSTVVMMEPGGGIAALAADSGQAQWSSDAGDRPLLAVDGRVLAQTETFDLGRLELAVLALADGSVEAAFGVEIDPAVRARVGDGLGERFGIAAVSAAGQGFVTWEHVARRIQGIPPPPGQGLESMRNGALSVDLAAGTAIVVDPGDVPAVGPGTSPVGFQQLVAGERLLLEPVRSGAVWAAVAARSGPAGTTTLVLQRWDPAANRPLAEVELWTGQPLHVWSTVADDVVLIAARTHLGQWQEYTWSAYSLASGAAAGEVRSSVARAPTATLDGGLLITVRPPSGRRIGSDWSEQPRRLVALDAGTGAEAWSRPLRDLSFRGPFPP